MADSSRSALAFKQETTWGESPSGTGWAYMPFRSHSLQQEAGFIRSRSLGSGAFPASFSRTTRDQIKSAERATGGIDFEYSNDQYEILWKLAMCSELSTLNSATESDLNISAASGKTATITDSHVSADAFVNIVAGQWFHATGWTTGTNNGYFRVTSKTDDATIAVEADRTLTNETTATAVVVKAQTAAVGNTPLSMVVETQDTTPDGASSIYGIFRGLRVDRMSLRVVPDEIVEGSVALIGKIGAYSTSTVIAGGSNNLGSGPLNAITNVGAFFAGDYQTPYAAAGAEVIEFSMEIQNNLRARSAVGTLGAVQVGLGTPVITGTLNVYLKDAALADLFEAGTETELGIRLSEATGVRATILSFPRVKFTGMQIPNPGENQDIIKRLTWEAQSFTSTLLAPRVDLIPA